MKSSPYLMTDYKLQLSGRAGGDFFAVTVIEIFLNFLGFCVIVNDGLIEVPAILLDHTN